MWMTDLHDEAQFDRMAAKMDLRPLIGRMTVPWLNVIGEKDELSPIRHTLDLAARCGSPSPIVIYEGERHALSGAPSLVLGPKFGPIVSDWLLDRSDGKPAEEYLDFITSSGTVERRQHPRQMART
jgi:pimeloyl-ACP methyl ester carboxylesterase